MSSNIYVLNDYVNQKNVKSLRHEREHEIKVKFSDNYLSLELSEINSLVEEKYCLKMTSARFVIEGEMSNNERKEAMIHHHPVGHPWKHLQFRLYGKHKVIRINLEPIDESDYIKCIKGFIYISQELINQEQKEHNVKVNLQEFFFNKKISELNCYGEYLLDKIKFAYDSGNMLDNDNNQLVRKEEVKELKNEKQLLPFLAEIN